MIVTRGSVVERSVSRFFGTSQRGVSRPPSEHRGAARLTALLSADAAAVVVSLAVAIGVLQTASHDTWPATMVFHASAPVQDACATFALTSLAVLAYFAGQSHYQRRVSVWTELQDIASVSLIALLFTGCVAFLLQSQGSLMPLPMVAWLIFPAAALGFRKVTRGALKSAGIWQRRAVLVAECEHARHALTAIQSEPGLGYDVVAVIDPADLGSAASGGRWRSLLNSKGAELLVLSYDARAALGREAVESVVRERVPFAVIPPPDGLPVLGFEPTRFFSHDTVMFSFRNNLARPLPRLIKITFDVMAAAIGLAVLCPLLLIISALVKLDGGPVLFGHIRVGAGGRRFRCLKFRSMVPNSDAVLQRVLETDPEAAAEWAATRKLRRDPRITTVGRLLRQTSLDELPQLLNVLRLEMSLVGPRPIVNAEVVRYGDDIAYYYETRPGLTGLWQVSGRTGTTYERRVQLDTWYVKNWTLWHDLAIIAKTIPAVLKQRGAC